MVWKPNVTVAAIIEQDGRFLLVEEHTSNGLKLNQPAGHLEEGESLIEAIKREVYEETAWQFEPSELISIQLWRNNPHSTSFLRCCFTGSCHSFNAEQALDEGIVATHWLSAEEMRSQKQRLRSPLVLTSLEEYLTGQRYPLDLLKNLLDIPYD